MSCDRALFDVEHKNAMLTKSVAIVWTFELSYLNVCVASTRSLCGMQHNAQCGTRALCVGNTTGTSQARRVSSSWGVASNTFDLPAVSAEVNEVEMRDPEKAATENTCMQTVQNHPHYTCLCVLSLVYCYDGCD